MRLTCHNSLRLLLVAFIWPLIATPAVAQEDDGNILDRHAYRLHSSSTTGVAPVSGEKYNYVVEADCLLNETQAKAYSTALTDSLASAQPDLGKIAVFLYMDGMDPASVAYAKAVRVGGEMEEQTVQGYVARHYPEWREAESCQW